MQYNFSSKQIKYIVCEYLNSKKSIIKIANEFNCSSSPIIRVLKDNNILIRNKRWYPTLSDYEICNLIIDYEKCKNLGIVSKKYNQTVYTVSKILRKNNIDIVNIYAIPRIREENWNNIVRLYLEGNSVTKIAKQYNISASAIAKILKKRNIEIINRQNIPRMNENIFEKIDSEEKAYWLGFIYADGYISGNEFGVGLNKSDINHLVKLKSFLEYSGNIRYKDSSNSCILSFRNKKIVNDLIKLGVYPRKSKILKFPSSKQIPKYLMRHFIRGYVDGDGHIGYNKHGLARLSILGTDDMLNGIITTMKFKRNKISKANKNGCEEVKEIEWCGKYVMDYILLLYNDSKIYLDRKYAKIDNIVNVRKRYMKKHLLKLDNTLVHRKAVNQFNEDGILIKRWNHLDDAARELNIRSSYIMRVCNKVRKHTGGYKWEYVIYDE